MRQVCFQCAAMVSSRPGHGGERSCCHEQATDRANLGLLKGRAEGEVRVRCIEYHDIDPGGALARPPAPPPASPLSNVDNFRRSHPSKSASSSPRWPLVCTYRCIRMRMDLQPRQYWESRVRCTGTVSSAGAQADPVHYDRGSLLTVDLMLSERANFEGGDFQTRVLGLGSLPDAQFKQYIVARFDSFELELKLLMHPTQTRVRRPVRYAPLRARRRACLRQSPPGLCFKQGGWVILLIALRQRKARASEKTKQ